MRPSDGSRRWRAKRPAPRSSCQRTAPASRQPAAYDVRTTSEYGTGLTITRTSFCRCGCTVDFREPPDLAFQDREEIRASYRNLLELFLRGGAYVGIATHDRALVDHALGLIRSLGLGKDAYEFQMLLGVLPDLRKSLIDAGHRLRVYVPYGAHWYGYSVRRLRENPKIAGYVSRDLLS